MSGFSGSNKALREPGKRPTMAGSFPPHTFLPLRVALGKGSKSPQPHPWCLETERQMGQGAASQARDRDTHRARDTDRNVTSGSALESGLRGRRDSGTTSPVLFARPSCMTWSPWSVATASASTCRESPSRPPLVIPPPSGSSLAPVGNVTLPLCLFPSSCTPGAAAAAPWLCSPALCRPSLRCSLSYGIRHPPSARIRPGEFTAISTSCQPAPQTSLSLPAQPEPGAEPGSPVQLVRLDEDGGLILDEEALSRCLEQGGVGGAPVCLVSIIGEQRRGKSFLLNYLLRRLLSPGVSDGSWMGREEEPLAGFEWRVGTQNVTRGLWAWSQPLWVPTRGSKILNIGCRVKDPDLEYLEMFMQVAEVVGEAYGLEPIQHLDLLVRDWTSSQLLGFRGGEQHLGDVWQGLAATSPCKHPKALDVLGGSSSCCYLMPFPGKRVATGSVGALRDMDEDFRESLRNYITALVGSARRHVRRDQRGEPLTGAQLAAKIKNLSEVMRTHRSGFSSPCQMAVTFHNQRALDSARQYYAAWLGEKDALSQRMADCLRVDPGAMAEELEEQRRLLLELGREELKEPEKEALLTALEQELAREAETFLVIYSERHQDHTVNQRALDRARSDHARFQREKAALSQRLGCLWVTPCAMKEQLVQNRRAVLRRCRREMVGPGKNRLLVALKVELTREATTFQKIYRRRYRCHAVKAGIVGGVALGSLVGGLGPRAVGWVLGLWARSYPLESGGYGGCGVSPPLSSRPWGRGGRRGRDEHGQGGR
ncbi:uncharacterized protein LOC112547711 isoform X3 [Pelodiscus sinensis]|uniref:uncharacterized protein LOC112547711 isoform X3 n=1 Tax=Pelodiscus sinensis TaxID=13735 RepID=UPI003F6B8090